MVPFILAFVLASLGMGLVDGGPPANRSAAGQPDIIVFMVDDLGAMSEAGPSDERILERLPNIRDLFLNKGLRFDEAYGETPLCCPGRAEFLAGQHVANTGVTVNKATLFDPGATIATALHDAGYYTMIVGKYFNHSDKLKNKMPPGWDKVAINLSGEGTGTSWAVQGNYQSEGFEDRFIIDQSLQWLQNAPADKAIFAYLTPHAPHYAAGHIKTPWVTDVESRYSRDGRCAGIEPWKPPTYRNPKKPGGFPLVKVCRSLLTVDDLVGAVRDEMVAQGRSPIYVLMDDNGMSWGSDGFLLKNVPQSTAIPLYFSGFGIPAGATNALVSNIDIAPTLADLAGTFMPKADGRSFAGVVLGASYTARDYLLENHPVGGNANGNGLTTTGPWWGVRRSDGWRLVEWPEWRGEALYSPDDPWEQHNVAPDHPDVVADLKSHGP